MAKHKPKQLPEFRTPKRNNASTPFIKDTAAATESENVTQNPLSDQIIRWSLILTALVLTWTFYSYMRIGFFNNIIEWHAYRQTQTALTAYYFLKDGFRFDYLTPMHGYPWKAPQEFPLQQYMAALVAKATSLNLDVAGRIASLFSALIAFLFSFLTIRTFTKNNYTSLIVLIIALVNPLIIYWSRTFLIESTAVALNLCHIWLCLEFLKQKRWFLIPLIIITGIVAPIIKATTGLVHMGVLGILFIYYFFNDDYKQPKTIIRYVLTGILFLGIPFASVLVWNGFTSSIDVEYTNYFWSPYEPSAKTWYYGTLEKRVTFETWQHINEHQFGAMLFLLIILVITSFTKIKYKPLILITGVFALAGPFIFVMLYYVHDYYSYAVAFLTAMCMGLFFSYFLIDVKNPIIKFVSFCLLLLFITYQYRNFKNSRYFNFMNDNSASAYDLNVAAKVKKFTKEDDGVIVFGYVGAPVIPYYSERKCVIMQPDYEAKAKKEPERFFKEIGKSNIKAMVVCDVSHQDMNLINKTLEYYKLNPVPVNDDVQTMGYYLFTAKK